MSYYFKHTKRNFLHFPRWERNFLWRSISIDVIHDPERFMLHAENRNTHNSLWGGIWWCKNVKYGMRIAYYLPSSLTFDGLSANDDDDDPAPVNSTNEWANGVRSECSMTDFVLQSHWFKRTWFECGIDFFVWCSWDLWLDPTRSNDELHHTLIEPNINKLATHSWWWRYSDNVETIFSPNVLNRNKTLKEWKLFLVSLTHSVYSQNVWRDKCGVLGKGKYAHNLDSLLSELI